MLLSVMCIYLWMGTRAREMVKDPSIILSDCNEKLDHTNAWRAKSRHSVTCIDNKCFLWSRFHLRKRELLCSTPCTWGGVSPHDVILITDKLSYKKNLSPLMLLTAVISILLSDIRSDLAYPEFITQPPCIMYGNTVLTRGVLRCSGAWLLMHHLSAWGTFMESSQQAGKAWGTLQVNAEEMQLFPSGKAWEGPGWPHL